MPLNKDTFDITTNLPEITKPNARTDSSYDPSKVRSALLSLPAPYYDDYDLWIKEVAIPLKNASDDLFPLFDEFSRQSAKYNADQCREKWQSIGTTTGPIKTVASIYYHARENGWRWEESDELPRTTIENAEARYPVRTMTELLGSDFNEVYLVEGVLIRGMPAIFGGPAKSLKTGQLMDLAYNLATGGKFLGKFPCMKSNVLILTGESGGAALQRRLKTLVAKYGVTTDDNSFLISESLPKFSCKADLEMLRQLAVSRESQVVIIDPVYLCMGSGEAGNIQAQGELLRGISEACSAAKATLVVAHHVTKAAAKEHRPLKLEDLSQAGFDAWARQWWLVSRRSEHELGSGRHELQVAVGNCSSHSMEWALDINEGTKDDPKWEVSITPMSELTAERRQQRAEAKLDHDLDRVTEALTKANAPLSKTAIKKEARIGAKRLDPVITLALELGTLTEVKGPKNSTCYALSV
jgi:hypothetical protein